MSRSIRTLALLSCALLWAAPSFAQATLDQSQTFYNGGTSARTLPGYTVWQSFTAGTSGTLSQIDMGFFNNMSGDGMLKIYAGEGTGGAVLASYGVPVTGLSNGSVTWNSWTVSVPVVAGQKYTFELTPNALTLPDPYGVCVANPGPYTGGVMGLNDPSGSWVTPFDTNFRTWVIGSSGSGGGSGHGKQKVDALILTPAALASGGAATGKVEIALPAPAGGVTVSLTSSNPGLLSVPATVFIPEGATEASFTATAATSVASRSRVKVTAAAGASKKAASVLLTP